MKSYFEINRNSWNKRVGVHLNSTFYDMEAFLSGKSSLKSIELDVLGDVAGLKLLHLQCHFGQDTLSLARLGAQCTGVDLSDVAIAEAQKLNDSLGLNATFICSNVYDYQGEGFDVVFSSYGTISWLPDLNAWAKVIAHALKPGGRLVFAEFHPVVWMFNDAFNAVSYAYFNRGALEEVESGTYAERNAALQLDYVNWNHGLAEVLQSLLDAGLVLRHVSEYDYSPWPCFAGAVEEPPGCYRIAHLAGKIPMVYALVAEKPM